MSDELMQVGDVYDLKATVNHTGLFVPLVESMGGKYALEKFGSQWIATATFPDVTITSGKHTTQHSAAHKIAWPIFERLAANARELVRGANCLRFLRLGALIEKYGWQGYGGLTLDYATMVRMFGMLLHELAVHYSVEVGCLGAIGTVHEVKLIEMLQNAALLARRDTH